MELKKVALTIGIAILFTLFVVFFIDAVYESPEYDQYCSGMYYPQPVKVGSENCPAVYNEQLFNQCVRDKGEVRYKYDERGCEKDPYCDYCSRDFNQVLSKYNKNILFISAIVGIIAILAGLYLPRTIDAIASGFLFGGILVVAQGTIRVFGDLGKTSRVVILGIELLVLVWIGYKKVRDKK